MCQTYVALPFGSVRGSVLAACGDAALVAEAGDAVVETGDGDGGAALVAGAGGAGSCAAAGDLAGVATVGIGVVPAGFSAALRVGAAGACCVHATSRATARVPPRGSQGTRLGFIVPPLPDKIAPGPRCPGRRPAEEGGG